MLQRSEIKKIDIFRGLSKNRMDELMSWLEVRQLPPHRAIIKEGYKPDGLYFLGSGEVEVIKRSSRGPLQLNVIEAPSIFGEISLLTHTPRSTSIRSLTPVELGFLSKDIFLSQLNKRNTTAFLITVNLGKLLSQRLAETNEQMELLTARERARDKGRKFRQANV